MIIEGKQDVGEKFMPQLISTAVISSFTEHNLHKSLNPLLPVVMLNCSKLRICMYDCIYDILLLSDYIEIRRDSHNISKFGLVLLWLLLNHR